MAKLSTGFTITLSWLRTAAGIGVLLALIVYASPALSGGRSDDPLGVAVSPQTFIIGMEQGSVSVHTDLPLSQVDRSAGVTLNGVAAIGIGADDKPSLYTFAPEFQAQVRIPQINPQEESSPSHLTNVKLLQYLKPFPQTISEFPSTGQQLLLHDFPNYGEPYSGGQRIRAEGVTMVKLHTCIRRSPEGICYAI